MQRNLRVVEPASDPDTLPHAIDFERVILGTILLWAGEGLDLVAAEMDANEFYLDRHKQIFRAMLRLHAEKAPVNPITLRGVMPDGEFERANDGSYLAGLIERDIGTVSTLGYYVKQVKEKAHARKLAHAGEGIRTIAMDGADPAPEIQEYAERLLVDIRPRESGDGPRPLATISQEAMIRLETNEAPQGITTGLTDLDWVLTTLEPGTLTIIGARPSIGKTALGLGIGLHTCASKKSPLFFSLEMTEPQIGLRLLAMKSGVDLHRMRDCQLERSDWARLGDAQMAFDSWPAFHIDAPRSVTATQICVRATQFAESNPISVVIVDFLTRLRFGEDKNDLRHQLGNAAKMFKDLAGQLNIPVIALSQLSRESVKGGRARMPDLSDLRESGNLEEDADNVLFIHRAEYYDPSEENKGQGEILVAKQRQGPAPKVVRVAFVGACTRFENLTRSELYAGH